MSYTYPGCDNEFTNGQGDRMRKAIQYKSILRNTIGNYCTTISRVDDNVCFGQTRTVSLTNVGSATTIWTSSSNVRITSSTNTSAQIRALYSSSSGNGSITATLDETTLREEFRVGKPSSNNLRITTTGNGNYLFSNIWQELFVLGNGGGEIEWRLSTSVWTRNCGQNCILVYSTSTSHGQGVLIRVRETNNCGESDWYYKEFTIHNTTSDEGPSPAHR